MLVVYNATITSIELSKTIGSNVIRGLLPPARTIPGSKRAHRTAFRACLDLCTKVRGYIVTSIDISCHGADGAGVMTSDISFATASSHFCADDWEASEITGMPGMGVSCH